MDLSGSWDREESRGILKKLLKIRVSGNVGIQCIKLCVYSHKHAVKTQQIAN